MSQDYIIFNQKRFDELKEKFISDGKAKLHLLADFDKTLTKAVVAGQRSPSVIAQIRNGNYLTPQYTPAAHRLFDKYHPIEIDPNISQGVKKKKMQEWWRKHFLLLIKCGLSIKVMDEIVSKKNIEFRQGLNEMVDLLYQNQIPLVIMSAGPGDMIIKHLKQENYFYDNVNVIANFLEFDKQGKVIGVKEPIIHSLNKNELVIKDYPIFDSIKDRKNVLLLGDNLEDIDMVSGFDYDNLIKIGFFQDEQKGNLADFKKAYDVILLNDSSLEFVSELIKEIVCL